MQSNCKLQSKVNNTLVFIDQSAHFLPRKHFRRAMSVENERSIALYFLSTCNLQFRELRSAFSSREEPLFGSGSPFITDLTIAHLSVIHQRTSIQNKLIKLVFKSHCIVFYCTCRGLPVCRVTQKWVFPTNRCLLDIHRCLLPCSRGF